MHTMLLNLILHHLLFSNPKRCHPFWAKVKAMGFLLKLTGQASGLKLIRTRKRQNDFVFFPSVTSLCVSCNSINIYRYLKVGFVQFLYQQHEKFTIYHIPYFQPNNFRGDISRKIQSSGSLDSKSFIFVSCLFNELRNANVFELIDGTPFS